MTTRVQYQHFRSDPLHLTQEQLFSLATSTRHAASSDPKNSHRCPPTPKAHAHDQPLMWLPEHNSPTNQRAWKHFAAIYSTRGSQLRRRRPCRWEPVVLDESSADFEAASGARYGELRSACDIFVVGGTRVSLMQRSDSLVDSHGLHGECEVMRFWFPMCAG
jgi:hypothetical protein